MVRVKLEEMPGRGAKGKQDGCPLWAAAGECENKERTSLLWKLADSWEERAKSGGSFLRRLNWDRQL